MSAYLSGKYWWLGIAAIVMFTLLLFHALHRPQPTTHPKRLVAVQQTAPKPISKSPLPTHPVLDLFNPSTAAISRNQAITRTRNELEQLLVISALLKQCGLLSDTEIAAIQNAAVSYAAHTKLFADSIALITELSASAETSYQLIYAATDCAEPSLHDLKSQTINWQAQFAASP